MEDSTTNPALTLCVNCRHRVPFLASDPTYRQDLSECAKNPREPERTSFVDGSIVPAAREYCENKNKSGACKDYEAKA